MAKNAFLMDTRQAKARNDFENIQCEICLDGDKNSETSQSKFFEGIRIQFEGILRMHYYYYTKNTGGKKEVQSVESIFAGSSATGKLGYIRSPFKQDVIIARGGDTESKGIIIQPGFHTYQFKIRKPTEKLPGASATSSGSVEYNLVAYMKTINGDYLNIATHTSDFNGYNDLSTGHYFMYTPFYPEFRNIVYSVEFKKTCFSKKEFLTTARITMNKTGFLPGEEIRIFLSFKNPKSSYVKQIRLSLHKWYRYRNHGYEFFEVEKIDNENIGRGKLITSAGKFIIKENAEPTFHYDGKYFIYYGIRIQIAIQDYEMWLECYLPVFIGTTKKQTLMLDEGKPSLPIERKLSANRGSCFSLSSHLQTVSLPSYSQLSSRAVSTSSLETLPPHYQDL